MDNLLRNMYSENNNGDGMSLNEDYFSKPPVLLESSSELSGKRKLFEIDDKMTEQKQRRMINNRESAARSRDKKQAYTVELESLVKQLEEDNSRLLRQEEELIKGRYKKLMGDLIPVTEMRRPPRALRRVHSMEW